jgi:Sec-independent protein translocase protein TatA
MLGIGFSEIVVIALVCFIAIGPQQLPVIMRKVAGLYRQFIALRDDLRFQVLSADNEILEAEKKQSKTSSEVVQSSHVVEREKSHG